MTEEADLAPRSLLERAMPWALLAAAVAYYASYAGRGFNVADEGNYAQMAYELYLGRDPTSLQLGYGLLWFQIGQLVFELTGPSILAVKGIFYAALTATVVLVYLTAHRLTANPILSAVVSVVVLLAPPFPPTAFYGLLVMANTYALLRWSEEGTTPWGISVGVVLAVTFLIRPDFGFVFAAVAIGLTIIGRQAGAALLIGLCGTLLVALAGGFLGGYHQAIVEPLVRYPILMWKLSMAGLSLGGTEGAVMARPALVDLLGFERVAATMAWLTYGAPVLVLLGLVIILFEGLREEDDEAAAAADLPQLSLAVVAGAAALPHFFLFRADLSHLANMMPGFAVLLAVIIERLLTGHMDSRLGRVGGLLGATAATLYLVGYAWMGVTQPGTGSLYGATGPMREIRSAGGVSVQVPPSEQEWMQRLIQTLDQQAEPGPIVCVPYCPGVAFLAGRAMAWDRFYVDRSVVDQNPAWLEEVTSRLTIDPPSAVVVFDWAVHGTEDSKFAVWAATYIDSLENVASEKVQIGGITLYLV